jgi:hypothetical protein
MGRRTSTSLIKSMKQTHKAETKASEPVRTYRLTKTHAGQTTQHALVLQDGETTDEAAARMRATLGPGYELEQV